MGFEFAYSQYILSLIQQWSVWVGKFYMKKGVIHSPQFNRGLRVVIEKGGQKDTYRVPSGIVGVAFGVGIS